MRFSEGGINVNFPGSWLRNMLNREGKKLGTGVISDEKGYFLLELE